MGRIEDSDLTIQELVLRKWEEEWDDQLDSTTTNESLINTARTT